MGLQRVGYTLESKEQHSKGRKSSTHKYDIKTSNKEKRVQMQNFGNAFEIQRQPTENNLVYIQTALSKPHGNCKPKIFNKYKHKKVKGIKNPHQIQSSNQNRREQKEREEKRPMKTNQSN